MQAQNWLHNRTRHSASLNRPVESMRFVSDARKDQLARLKISKLGDLSFNVAHRYLDFSEVSSVLLAPVGHAATIIVTVDSVTAKRLRSRKTLVEVGAYDETGVVILGFFNQPWMAEQLKTGMRLLCAGKMGLSGGFKRMTPTHFEILDDNETLANRREIVPLYSATQGLSRGWVARLVAEALIHTQHAIDPLEPEIREEFDLISHQQLIRVLHAPATKQEVELATRRLAFDELLLLQLALLLRKEHEILGTKACVHTAAAQPAGQGMFERYLTALPFEFTADQDQALREICADMCADQVMNRMLLGDVGTGKTVVAGGALAACAQSGYQGVMMAPTSVLAQQYAQSLGGLLTAAGVRWALLTGSTPRAERRDLLVKLKSHKIDCLFGTHALLEEEVQFAQLGLAIIDEQHRFGVSQRARLRQKGKGADLLVMSATPIPRTLALSFYGDLDLSIIRTRPRMQSAVTTTLINKQDRGIAYAAMLEAIERGEQCYVICPLIGTKSKADEVDHAARLLEEGKDPSLLRAATQELEVLSRTVFAEHRVGLLTGALKSQEKDEIMQEFRAGKIDVLVATTVVEVGVDVPNATVMLNEDAERFGLAQLHQLRGRVGRGSKPGQVFLAASTRSPQAKKRLHWLEESSDGFELATHDLSLRKEGELVGSKQHGSATLRFVDFARDLELIEAVHSLARAIVADDPTLSDPKYALIKSELLRQYADVFRQVSGG